MPSPEEPAPRQTWAVSERNSSPPSASSDLDLFAAAPKSEEGYLKWRTETAQ